MAQAQTCTRLVNGKRGQTHAFLSTGQNQIGVTCSNGLRRQMDRLQARTTQLVERHGGHLVGQTRIHGSLTGRILACAGGQDLAQNDLVNLIGGYARRLEHGTNQLGAQIVGGHRGQPPLKTADGGTGRGKNRDIFVHIHSFPKSQARQAGPLQAASGQRQDQYICWPPFMATLLPVIKPAASLAIKVTNAAISSGCPKRPTGMPAIMLLRTSSGTAMTIFVAR